LPQTTLVAPTTVLHKNKRNEVTATQTLNAVHAAPGKPAAHNQLNAVTPQLQAAVAGLKDMTSNDLCCRRRPLQTRAAGRSLKPNNPNAPALPQGPMSSTTCPDAEAAPLGLDGGRWAHRAAGDATTHPARPALASQK